MISHKIYDFKIYRNVEYYLFGMLNKHLQFILLTVKSTYPFVINIKGKIFQKLTSYSRNTYTYV